MGRAMLAQHSLKCVNKSTKKSKVVAHSSSSNTEHRPVGKRRAGRVGAGNTGGVGWAGPVDGQLGTKSPQSYSAPRAVLSVVLVEDVAIYLVSKCFPSQSFKFFCIQDPRKFKNFSLEYFCALACGA